MALSGFTTLIVSETLNLLFKWEAEQDKQRRVSTVSWIMQLEAFEGGGIDAVPGSPWEVTIDGQSFSGRTNITVAAGSATTLAEGVVELEHRWWDGGKSFEYSFSQRLNIYVSSGYIDTVYGNGVGELDPFVYDPFCYRSYAIGIATGLRLAGRYEEKSIIGYSFNGVFLPGLPARDEDALSNAVMLLVPGTMTYRLLLCAEFTVESHYDEDCIVIPEGSVCHTYDPQNDTGWSEGQNMSSSTQYKLKNVFWSNTRIRKSDGSLYIAAMKPIPVYG